MARAFADITFTESVKAAQTLYGSREGNRSFELAEDPRNTLGHAETAFIEDRDSFYQATVSENGWPYVQHRGGPVGFVKVIDERTLGYADFRGNRQYISVGNINADDRVSLIFMDYANRRRIKIWGRAKIVHESEMPELVAHLEDPQYRARIERAVVIRVEAFEWNCPQHITPRFTEQDVRALIAQFEEERLALEAQSKAAEPALAKQPATQNAVPVQLGDGELVLEITGIRQLTPSIRAYELRSPLRNDLPPVAPGAHIQVPVILENGSLAWRSYSISSNPKRRDVYEIAVQREETGRGGSIHIHERYSLGLHLGCRLPKNDFFPTRIGKKVVLIAGGVGITAIKPIAQYCVSENIECELHYAGRSTLGMAFYDRLAREFDSNFNSYLANENQRLDITKLISNLDRDTDVFVCGPERMISEVKTVAERIGFPANRIHAEGFGAEKKPEDKAFNVQVIGREELVLVDKDQTVLDALEDAGVMIKSECRAGNCGQCVVTVVSGEVDHRDQVLSKEEQQSGKMCVCVSRATRENLVLIIEP